MSQKPPNQSAGPQQGTGRPRVPHTGETHAQAVRRVRDAKASQASGGGTVPSDEGTGHETGSSTTRVNVDRRTIVLRLPDGWARALLCGLEACVFGWGIIMLATLVAYAAMASNPWLGDATWQEAVGVGGDIWAAGHGAAVHVGESVIRVIPLILVLMNALILRGLLAGGSRFSAAAQWASVPGYVLAAIALAGVSADHAAWWSVIPGAIATSGLAAGWAYLAQTRPWSRGEGVGRAVWKGIRQALLSHAAVTAAATILFVVAVSTASERIAGIRALMSMGAADEIGLTVAQGAFLPNALAWVLAWLSGAGFHTATDALHTPGAAPVEPIPAVPMLGAIPQTPTGTWVVLIPILLGIVIGAVFARVFRTESFRLQVIEAVAAVVMFAAVTAIWMAASTMELGQGRLADMGPRVWLSTLLLTLEVIVVAQLVVVLSHPVAVARAKTATAAGVSSAREMGHAAAEKVEARRGGSADEPGEPDADGVADPDSGTRHSVDGGTGDD